MPTPAETLKEIHRLRRFAKDLQVKLEQLPRQLQSRQRDVAYHEQKLREAQDTLKTLKVQAKDNDLSIRTASEQIQRYETQLNGIISKKEYDALRHEIEHARKRIEELEDKGLTALSEIDDWTGRLPELEATLRQAREELARFEAESQARQKDLSGELQRAQAAIGEVEAALPEGDFQNKYQRLIKAKGEDAFAGVKARSCQACYTEVTAQMLNDLRAGQLVFCKSCGRIIYSAD